MSIRGVNIREYEVEYETGFKKLFNENNRNCMMKDYGIVIRYERNA
jgi:hypothetical protein